MSEKNPHLSNDYIERIERARFIYRSAVTGRFVSEAYAEQHPDTTIRQLVVRNK